MRHGPALLVAAFVAALPSLAGAQPGRGAAPGPRPSAEAPAPERPDFERPAFGGVTRILNLRRVLDLTPRQVAQLDSIERAVAAERRPALERMRAEREAMRGREDGRPLSPDSARARAERLRPRLEQFRRSDSLATVAAERLLTDAQRQRVRELRAYARGRMEGGRGPRAGGAPRARGMRGPRGMMGPRGRVGGRGGFGPRGWGGGIGGFGGPRGLGPAPRAPQPPRPPEE